MKNKTPRHEGMKRNFPSRLFVNVVNLGSKMNFGNFEKHAKRIFSKGPKTP